MPARRGSFDLILDEVRRDRDMQVKYLDSIDARAGAILGFAGALVALFPSNGNWIAAGRVAAVVSGLTALWTFWPRELPRLSLPSLRETYAHAEPEFTRIRLVDTYVQSIRSLSLTARVKALRLKVSMAALALGTLLAGVGLVLD